MTIEERKNAVLEKIESMKITEDRIKKLEENDEALRADTDMLTACVLEMSEIIYA